MTPCVVRFKKENAAMHQQVDKLMKAQEELTQTSDALQATTSEYKANISKFKEVCVCGRCTVESNLIYPLCIIIPAGQQIK